MIRATVGRLRSIPAREWPDIAASVAWAIVVELGLRLVPLPRLARFVGVTLDTSEQRGRCTALPPTATARTRRQLRATRRVMRHWPYGDTCLRHALVLARRLRRLDPVLHLGVASIEGEVRAHAWLEVDGAIVDPLGSAGSYERLEPVRPAGGT